MSNDINKMDYKQLRNEVQLLRDELAIMQRKYEDIIYNLDTDNFSSRFVKEQGDMRTAIKVTAEGIESKVSNDEFESTKAQTAQKIESEVKKLTDADKELSSKITQTADAIRSDVKSATEALDGKLENYSTKAQTAESISSAVESVNTATNNKLKNYTTIEQTADAIKSQAYASADLSSAIQITDLTQATDQTKTYYIEDGSGNKNYYYYNKISKEWEEIVGGGIDTVFEQTETGFKLKGNVLIDGDTVVTENLKLSGNVTWDMSNSPVLTRYSADQVNWHSPMVDGDLYMQMSFDGGKHWSTTTKVVGTDGKNGTNGTNGTNATVTPQKVFEALTDSGANQGIFAAFVEKENQIYINAEYIATNYLYLGDLSSNWDEKSIYFNNQANLSTYNYSGLGQDGFVVNSNGFGIACKPDEIYLVAPNGSSFVNGRITLEDYVSQYGSGGGTVVAVFG